MLIRTWLIKRKLTSIYKLKEKDPEQFLITVTKNIENVKESIKDSKYKIEQLEKVLKCFYFFKNAELKTMKNYINNLLKE